MNKDNLPMGFKIPSPSYECSDCLKPVDKNDIYCRHCGNNVEEIRERK